MYYEKAFGSVKTSGVTQVITGQRVDEPHINALDDIYRRNSTATMKLDKKSVKIKIEKGVR